MSIAIGALAPDFATTTSDGQPFHLSAFRGKKNVILFFYPGDFTPVCTQEACAFRDAYSEFANQETEVIGISSDSHLSHQKFSQTHRLGFPLISDPDETVARLYGAKGGLFDWLGGKRLTFLIDKQGIVVARFDSALRAEAHVRHIRQALKALPASP